MTIRTRLIVAAFLSSAIVAVATSASTLFLYRASSQLQVIHSKLIPTVRQAGNVENNAGELAQTMEDFMDAKTAGDKAGVIAASNKINSHFSALHASIDSLALDASSISTDNRRQYLIELDRFRQAAKSLDADWSRLRDVGPENPQFSQATELDDDAIRLARSATQLQGSAINAISSSVDTANSYVIWVSRLSAIIAASMSITTLFIGITFASRLARRLIRVRNQAQIVGTGNLDTILEVEGQDEIDDIALSFNGMVHALRGSREKLERDALYDGLTGLPNRGLFMQRLSRRVLEGSPLKDQAYVLYFLDVDHFKQVNDTLGHAAGDELLRIIAARLTTAVDQFPFRSAVIKTVARLAGDEFTILLEGNLQPDEAMGVGEHIRAAVAAPMTIEEKPLIVTASIGVALGHPGVSDAKHILTQADIALYHTKRQGRNGCSLYAAFMEGDEAEKKGEIDNPQSIIRARRDMGAAALT